MKQLLLLDGETPPPLLNALMEKLQPDSLILGETAFNTKLVAEAGHTGRTVRDFFLPSSGAEADVCNKANVLAKTWTAEHLFGNTPAELTYFDVSLWDLLQYDLNGFALQLMFNISTLRLILSSESRAVVLVGNGNDPLAESYEALRAGLNLGPAALLQNLKRGTRKSLMHRAYRGLFSTGWLDQLFFDAKTWRRSRTSSQKNAPASAKDTFLFVVCDYGIYASTVVPVIKQLSKTEHALVFSEGNLFEQDVLSKNGIAVERWSFHVPLEGWARARKAAGQLKQFWKKWKTNPNVPELFRHEGLSLWPAACRWLEQQFHVGLPRLMLKLEALKNVFQTYHPRALVALPDVHSTEHAAVKIARLYGVESLYIQPCLICDHPNVPQLVADRAAVMDDLGRRVMLARGRVAPQRIELVGLPRWDNIPKLDAKIANIEMRKCLNLSPQDRYVVFATDNTGFSGTEPAIRAVLKALNDQSNMTLVIKPHPHEARDLYEEAFSPKANPSSSIPINVVSQVELHNLIAACELLITGFSNVAVEAALLNKPVIVFNMTSEADPLPFAEEGVAAVVHSLAELEVACRRQLAGNNDQFAERRKAFRTLNPQLLDGHSTERIVELLKHMAAERKTGSKVLWAER